MARKVSAIPTTVRGFGDYFDSGADAEEILKSLGFSYVHQRYALPRYAGNIPFVAALHQHIERIIPRVTLTSEIARREFLIAPVLSEIALEYGVTVRVEHAVNVSPALRGSLDYLVDAGDSGNLVLIEAKLGDMYRGFKQLVAELVALDQWTDSETPLLFGAVSIGTVWQFAVLDRAAKAVTQDMELFRIPGDLEDLTRVIVGILHGTEG